MQRTYLAPGSVAPTRIGWGLRVAFSLAGVAAVAATIVDAETASVIMAATVFAGLVIAGSLFIKRSRSLDDDERRAWTLVGAGLLVAASGIIFFGVSWLISPDVGAFGPADLLFLLGYFVGLSGFAILPHTYGSGLLRLRLLLDAVIGAVAAGILLWVLFLDGIAEALSGTPVWERITGSSYVLLDLAMFIVTMIVVVRRSNLRFDARLMLFGLAVTCQAAADMTFLLRGAGRTFAEAEPIYALHIVAITLFVGTASIVDRVPREREYADRSVPPGWAMVLPYGFAAFMVIVLLTKVPGEATSPSFRGLLYATLLVGVLVVSRQAVAIRENRRLVEDRRTALVASISHELRTPLTAVVGFLELLDSDGIDDVKERTEVTTIATQQASYLSRIVSDLLMLASGDTATMELDVASTAIDELAWASVNAAAVDPAVVRVDAERGVTAYLDTGRIQQALANLLANAVRYGGETVLIVARADAGDLSIEVHDDGPGVPRKFELMIWDKFERGPNRLNSTIPGSGIGLAITNAIATAHGGSVGYRRSERLGGACFWIRLPGRVHADPGYAASDGSANLTVVTGRQHIKSA